MREEFAKKILEQVRDDYDSIADNFSATRDRLWPEMEQAARLVKTGDRLLDVGCGNGRAYRLFAGRAIDYVGLDASPRLLAAARRANTDQLVDFRVGSWLELPFGAGEFDAVVAFAVLHHIPSAAYRLRALQEAARVLKPGGFFVMTNWNLWRPRFWREHLAAWGGKLFGRADYDWGDRFVAWRAGGVNIQRYVHAFTRGEVARLCRAAGFDIDENRVFAGGGNIYTVCRKK